MADWTPAEIDTLLWLDASDSDTITEDTGVSEWADKSGNGNDVSQATAASQPTYDSTNQCVCFDGDDDCLTLASRMGLTANPDIMVFAVFDLVNLDTGRFFQVGGSYSSMACDVTATDGWAWRYNGGYEAYDDATDQDGTRVLVVYTRPSGGTYADGQFYLHGTEQSASGSSNPSSYPTNTEESTYVGCGETTSGDQNTEINLYELIVINGTENRQKVEGYLAWRWGTNEELPTDHPYYDAAPTDAETVAIRNAFILPYGDLLQDNRAYADLPYNLHTSQLAIFDLIYGLQLGAAWIMRYGNAPTLRAAVEMYYSDCPVLRKGWNLKYDDMLMHRRSWQLPYAIPQTLLAAWDMRYHIAASEIRSVHDLLYDLQTLQVLRQQWQLPYLMTGDGVVRTVDPTAQIAGNPVPLVDLETEADWEDVAISAELHLLKESDYVQCEIGDAVEIVLEETTYVLFVDDKRETISERGQITWIVECLSPVMQLSEDYAGTLTTEDDIGYDGQAATIVAEIMAAVDSSLVLNWNIDDFPVEAYTCFANDESPLAVIQKIIETVGGIIQSDPDGTVRIEYGEPDDWETREPDLYITWGRDFISQDVTLEKRSGANSYYISNQSSSDDSISLESEEVSDTVQQLLGFMVPWEEIDFELTHTGDDTVSAPEYLGIVEATYPDEDEDPEVVEFVAGYANTTRPIYGDLQYSWKKESLGAITYGEDGSLEAEVKDGTTMGYGLAEVRYTTKYHLWQAVAPEGSEVQYLLRRLDDE